MIYIFEGTKPWYFWQFIEVLSKELSDLGFQNQVVNKINLGTSQDLYIIFDAFHLIMDGSINEIQTINYIFYNTEQLTWKDRDLTYFPTYRKAKEIWCHSKIDSDYLEKNGIASRYFPFGYSKYFELIDEKIPQSNKKPTAIWLYWGACQRRRDWVQQLERVECQSRCWCRKDYKKLLSEHGVFVNIHKRDDDGRLELFRILPLLSNNCLVISEQSFDNIDLKKHVIECDDAVHMNMLINHHLDNPEETEKIIVENKNWLVNNFTFEQNLSKSGCLDALKNLSS